MATPDIWVTLLPIIYSGIWGGEALYDPNQMLYTGPADQQVVGGLGSIFRANNPGEVGAGEATGAYVYGYRAYGFQPKVMTFVTSRGDVIAGLGIQDDFVFHKISLLPDGSAPLFFSFAGAPSFYLPGPAPRGNYGHSLQFQMTDEIGFYVGKSWRVSFAYNHYSDGGFTNINPNSNGFTLNLGYRF